jgi:hypothetical protein
MDIAEIMLKLRRLNYFMKMYLEIDQRKLLKLRSSILIESDQDEKKSIYYYQKIYDEDKL